MSAAVTAGKGSPTAILTRTGSPGVGVGEVTVNDDAGDVVPRVSKCLRLDWSSAHSEVGFLRFRFRILGALIVRKALPFLSDGLAVRCMNRGFV